MTLTATPVQVASNLLGAPVFQTHFGCFGIIETSVPFMGQKDWGITDDYGNVVEIHWSQLAASVAN